MAREYGNGEDIRQKVHQQCWENFLLQVKFDWDISLLEFTEL